MWREKSGMNRYLSAAVNRSNRHFSSSAVSVHAKLFKLAETAGFREVFWSALHDKNV